MLEAVTVIPVNTLLKNKFTTCVCSVCLLYVCLPDIELLPSVVGALVASIVPKQREARLSSRDEQTSVLLDHVEHVGRMLSHVGRGVLSSLLIKQSISLVPACLYNTRAAGTTGLLEYEPVGIRYFLLIFFLLVSRYHRDLSQRTQAADTTMNINRLRHQLSEDRRGRSISSTPTLTLTCKDDLLIDDDTVTERSIGHASIDTLYVG
jgi:hypothetical protein